MLKCALVKFARFILPRRAVIAARTAHIRLRGHARTNALGMCVNAAGEPIPWLTGPAIDYLDSLELAGARVFEFGMGASTAYWARRGCSVTGVEMDPSWHSKVESLALPGVEARLCTDGGAYPRSIDEVEGQIDWVNLFDAVLMALNSGPSSMYGSSRQIQL